MAGGNGHCEARVVASRKRETAARRLSMVDLWSVLWIEVLCRGVSPRRRGTASLLRRRFYCFGFTLGCSAGPRSFRPLELDLAPLASCAWACPGPGRGSRSPPRPRRGEWECAAAEGEGGRGGIDGLPWRAAAAESSCGYPRRPNELGLRGRGFRRAGLRAAATPAAVKSSCRSSGTRRRWAMRLTIEIGTSPLGARPRPRILPG